jgi:hypothetical protein
LDGNAWTIQASGTQTNLYAVTFGNGLFVAGGDSGTILSSPDGKTWSTPISITTNRISVLTSGRGLLVACDIFVYTSSDGLAWTNVIPAGSYSSIRGVAYGLGTFVTVDFQGSPRTSGDITNWDYRTSLAHPVNSVPPTTPLNAVAYGRGTFVAVGDLGTIIQSDPVLNLQAGTLSYSGFTLTSAGETGPAHVLQTSTNLATWRDYTNYVQSQPTVSLQDASATNAPRSFYRVKPE